MSTLSRGSVPLHRRPVDPALRPGIGELHVWLLIEKDYPQIARERVIRHVAATGTLEGAESLDPEDRAEAEEVFVNALEPVSFDDPAWDDPGSTSTSSRSWKPPGPSPMTIRIARSRPARS